MQSAPPFAGSTAWIEWSPSSSTTTSSPRPTSRSNDGAEQVERARLRGHDPVVAQPADRERAEAVGVAEGEELAFGDRGDRERALEAAHRGGDGLGERPLVGRHQRGDQLGVGRGGEADARGGQLLAQLRRIDEVAVVPERDGAGAAVMDERLRVLPRVGARRRVAVVADRELAGEAVQLLLVEHLRHEPEVAQHGQAAALGHGDSGRLLAAVLERHQPEVAQPRDVPLGRPDAEHAAHQTVPSSRIAIRARFAASTATTTPGPFPSTTYRSDGSIR